MSRIQILQRCSVKSSPSSTYSTLRRVLSPGQRPGFPLVSCKFQLLLSDLIEKIEFFFIKIKNMEAESKNKIRTFEAVFVRKIRTLRVDF